MPESRRTAKEGDVVQLKSGGPLMTVARLDPGSNGRLIATCQWFEGAKEHTNTFPVDSLTVDEG